MYLCHNSLFQLLFLAKKEKKKKIQKKKKGICSIPVRNTGNIKYIKTDISMYKIVVPWISWN